MPLRCPLVGSPRRFRLPLLAASLAAGLALAACGSGSVRPASPTSGIDLLTMAGPTCPVQHQGATCERPISARVVIEDASGNAVTTVQTGSDGTAHVGLPPGSYQVAPQGSGTLPRPPAATTATVTSGAFVTVRLDYDTGMR